MRREPRQGRQRQDAVWRGSPGWRQTHPLSPLPGLSDVRASSVPTACAVGYDLTPLARLEGNTAFCRGHGSHGAAPPARLKKQETLGWLVQPRVFLIVLAVGPDRQTGYWPSRLASNVPRPNVLP